MSKVSINILTKNRSPLLRRALDSICAQSFADFEVIAVNDGSADDTLQVLENFKTEKLPSLKIISHEMSIGITESRQEALLQSQGEYIAILDDDDEWMSADKLKKQVEFLDSHPDYVLVGGGILMDGNIRKLRPKDDQIIRRNMLFMNNFFTSTVMFKKSAAMKTGGFIKDEDDFSEDYDLWLRLGKIGKMHNFEEIFANYRQPNYNKARYKAFLNKQLRLVNKYSSDYPKAFFAKLILNLRLI